MSYGHVSIFIRPVDAVMTQAVAPVRALVRVTVTFVLPVIVPLAVKVTGLAVALKVTSE